MGCDWKYLEGLAEIHLQPQSDQHMQRQFAQLTPGRGVKALDENGELQIIY